MEKRTTRVLSLAGAIVTLFIATVAILLNVIPGPHKRLDYVVIGAVATFLAMALLWLVISQGWLNIEDPKQDPTTEVPKE